MLGHLKLSLTFLSLSSFFWILVSSFFSGGMFLSSFWSTPLIWVPVSFTSLLVPCTISFVYLSIGFIFSSGFQPNSTNYVSVLKISVLNCASDRLAIPSLLSYISSGALIYSFIWAIFFLSWCTCYVKGRSLRCLPGWGNVGHCAVMLYVGNGLRGSNGACSTLHWISVPSSTTHNQTGPLWCWFPSEWACAHSRPLWVSPTTSPVRLGVSPAAASTPMGVFNQRFEALFPRAGALGWEVCLTPQVFLPVYLCVNVGLWGLLAAAWSALFHNPPPHWVRQPPPCRECSLPGCPSPPLLPVWMNVSSLSPWLSDFHTVRFSVSLVGFCF